MSRFDWTYRPVSEEIKDSYDDSRPWTEVLDENGFLVCVVPNPFQAQNLCMAVERLDPDWSGY